MSKIAPKSSKFSQLACLTKRKKSTPPVKSAAKKPRRVFPKIKARVRVRERVRVRKKRIIV